MLPQSLLLLISASLATAGPIRRRCESHIIPAPTNLPFPPSPPGGPTPSPSPTPTPSPSPIPSPAPSNPDGSSSASPATPLPTIGAGATELPQPDLVADAEGPKYMVLGHGIQNYTCSGVSAGSSPAAAGALAMLWDISPLYPSASNAESGTALPTMDDFEALSAYVLYNTDLPLNMAGSPRYAAEAGAPFPDDFDLPVPAPEGRADLPEGGVTLSFAGHHYFDASSTPTFDLYASPSFEEGSGATALMRAAVGTKVDAPADADKGVTGTGAVQWLYLTDAGGSAGGVSVTYRVYTAGGVAEACSGDEAQAESVPYTAMYWIY